MLQHLTFFKLPADACNHPMVQAQAQKHAVLDQEVVFDHIYTFEPILLHPSAQQGSRRSEQRESSRLSKGYPRLAHVLGVSLQLPTLFFLYLSLRCNEGFLMRNADLCTEVPSGRSELNAKQSSLHQTVMQL
jgi:hypothetical protein